MKVADSRTFNFLFGNKLALHFTDGTPAIKRETALPLAETVHDSLAGKGLSFTQIWLVLHLVIETFREERNAKAL